MNTYILAFSKSDLIIRNTQNLGFSFLLLWEVGKPCNMENDVGGDEELSPLSFVCGRVVR